MAVYDHTASRCRISLLVLLVLLLIFWTFWCFLHLMILMLDKGLPTFFVIQYDTSHADLCRSTPESQKKDYSDAKFTNDQHTWMQPMRPWRQCITTTNARQEVLLLLLETTALNPQEQIAT